MNTSCTFEIHIHILKTDILTSYVLRKVYNKIQILSKFYSDLNSDSTNKLTYELSDSDTSVNLI